MILQEKFYIQIHSEHPSLIDVYRESKVWGSYKYLSSYLNYLNYLKLELHSTQRYHQIHLSDKILIRCNIKEKSSTARINFILALYPQCRNT